MGKNQLMDQFKKTKASFIATKIARTIRSLSFPIWSVPIGLIVLGLITYGLYIPRLGLYWDDWAKLLTGRLWGMNSYWAYYAEDRPFSAWTHIVLTPLLGYNPLPWQIFTFVMRLLSVVGIWWTLKNIWPEKPRIAIYTSLLLLVYPVFDQQAIAVTFHQQWMQFALLAFSFGLTVKALQQKKFYWIFTVFSVLLSFALGLFYSFFYLSKSNHRCHKILFSSNGTATPSKCGISRAV